MDGFQTFRLKVNGQESSSRILYTRPSTFSHEYLPRFFFVSFLRLPYSSVPVIGWFLSREFFKIYFNYSTILHPNPNYHNHNKKNKNSYGRSFIKGSTLSSKVLRFICAGVRPRTGPVKERFPLNPDYSKTLHSVCHKFW